jgi:hypothetical protein
VDDGAIKLNERHARGAGARLEVGRECCGGDEGFITSAAGTAHVSGLVGPGVYVVTEIALALEMPIARPAVIVRATVYVVLLPCVVARKIAVAGIAWPVGIGIVFMLLEGAVVWERSSAAITIGQ